MSRVSPSISGDLCEVLVAARKLSEDDNGKTFFLNLAGGFNVDLPAPKLGLELRFVVKLQPTTAYTITARDAAGSAANIVKGHVLSADLNAASDGDIDTTAVDIITFAANKAVAGDRLHLICDGTFWYYSAETAVFDGISAA